MGGALVTPISSFALSSGPAFECNSAAGATQAVSVTATIDLRSQAAVAVVEMKVNDESYSDSAKFKYFSKSSLGHSRCPGVWSEIKFTPNTGQTPLDVLSIVTEEHFYGCGFAGPDFLKLTINGEESGGSLFLVEI